jgi:glycosidase
MLKRHFMLTIFLVVCIAGITQDLKVYPTHWWTGMKNTKLQLMIHGDNALPASATVNYPGVRLVKTTQPENKNYVFADLEISPAARPGKFTIKLSNGKQLSYELKARVTGNGRSRVKGVHSSDFIYLIMPDRFANGDESNDRIATYRDTESDRSNPFARHGGDLKGVENHLDYIKDLGATAVWMTPVMENNMPRMQEGSNLMSGYHGYWITNHYEVDKRMGGNEAYHQLINAAHSKGLKIIQDAVYNHVGSFHHTVLDLPMKDWLNQWPSYQGANHREEVFMDPYTAAADKKIMIGGWFVPHLPDLNLANPYVSTYVIQSSIWATEEFGIDGWRVDTYKYCDEKFLNRINSALVKEFPSITVFGEAWTQTAPSAAYFVENNMQLPFKHNLQGVTDFPLNGAMYDAVNQNADWTGGINKLYMTLSLDGLYKNPMRNCIFMDNHDMNRYFSMVGENMNKYKMGMALLLTMRGIPQIYYGTEVLMKNFKNPTDAEVRKDFPGGWNGDAENKFLAANRTNAENEAFNYIKKIADFRKNSPAITKGKLIHYIPQDGVYVYFRYTADQTVMCILNSNDREAQFSLARFADQIKTATKATDIATGTTFNLEPDMKIGPKYLLVLELK